MAAESAQFTPMTFDAANKWLASRVNYPTKMTSAKLALDPEFDARVRMHCFFSAKVNDANVLEDIRTELADYAAGTADKATARWRIKTALARHGYNADDVGMTDTPPAGMDEDEWKKRKAITNLASTRRVDLILDQNARMAWAAGRDEVSLQPAVMERWPYWRYLSRDDGRERPSHGALHNLILLKTNPFWATHTGPWDFGCRCDKEDADEAEAREYGTGQAVTTENPDGSQTAKIVNPATGAAGIEIPPSPSGFVFRSDEPFAEFDMGRVKNLDMRREIRESLEIAAGTYQTGKKSILSFAAANPVPEEARIRVDWKSEGLASSEQWDALPRPERAEPRDAKARLESGIRLTDIEGGDVVLGQGVLDHWNGLDGSEAIDENNIYGRLRKLNMAVRTVEAPKEIWRVYDRQHGSWQRTYVQKFEGRNERKFTGCLVAVNEDTGDARTYFPHDARKLDNGRHGAERIYGERKETASDGASS
ncbi:MAG: phage minor head protein [Lentisphaeria bacterium]|nr:phage minor head protein [Lentisphaeria bacterium]